MQIHLKTIKQFTFSKSLECLGTVWDAQENKRGRRTARCISLPSGSSQSGDRPPRWMWRGRLLIQKIVRKLWFVCKYYKTICMQM
jgi:hypothetical protein